MQSSTKSITRLIRHPQVKALTGLSRTALYAAMAANTFPKPIKLGGTRSVAWVQAEVDMWIAEQVAASRGAAT